MTVATPVVAVLGTRYVDLTIEQEILDPLGARLVSGPGDSAGAIVSVAAEADVILTGTSPLFGADVLAQLAARGIVRYGVGLDSIDLAAAARLGKWVVNTPGHGTEAVALHTVSLILAGLRRLKEADASVRSGAWTFEALRPLHLPEALTAGIIGFGRIGRRVAEMLMALGFSRVLAHDPNAPIDLDGVTPATLDDLVRSSDVVTLHAWGAPAAEPLFGAAMLARCKPGSILVNTARGSHIDSAALARALRAGAPAFAAVDVLPTEPPGEAPFADVADLVMVTPHMAWYAEETEIRTRRAAAEQARRILTGEEPNNVAARPQEGARGA